MMAMDTRTPDEMARDVARHAGVGGVVDHSGDVTVADAGSSTPCPTSLSRGKLPGEATSTPPRPAFYSDTVRTPSIQNSARLGGGASLGSRHAPATFEIDWTITAKAARRRRLRLAVWQLVQDFIGLVAIVVFAISLILIVAAVTPERHFHLPVEVPQ